MAVASMTVKWNNENEVVVSHRLNRIIINLSDGTIEKNGKAIDPTEGLAGPESLAWTLYHKAHENDYYCTSTVVQNILESEFELYCYIFEFDKGLYVITDERGL